MDLDEDELSPEEIAELRKEELPPAVLPYLQKACPRREYFSIEMEDL